MTSSHIGPSSASLSDQIVSTAVDAINASRMVDKAVQLSKQDQAMADATDVMQTIHEFIDKPGNILGSHATKHGEIAEVVDVGIRRARDLIAGRPESADFGAIGRNAPADYFINGQEVQSKFINGTSKGLQHVIDHLEQYKHFGRDGSFYIIPKNQHEQILRVLNGDIDGMSKRTVDSVLEKVRVIQDETGKSFQEAVRPSVSTYAEVQQGQIDNTLKKHEDGLSERYAERKEQIVQDHAPSWSEGATATAAAGAVGAGIGFATAAFKKYREGKNIFRGDFSSQDWKDIGGETLVAGAGGAVTGASVYVLTNCAELSAPLAGAFVSAVKGVAPLVVAYRRGEMSKMQLVDAGMFVCCDVAIVAGCTAAGQALIPIPILGAVLGSLAGKVLSQVLSTQLQGATRAIENRVAEFVKELDAESKLLIAGIVASFEQLGELTTAAFDLAFNVGLVERSLQLARAYGVEESKLLKNVSDLDQFMLE